MAKKPDPFNNPFKGLKLPARPEQPKPAAPPPPPKRAREPTPDDDRLFFDAMAGVVPIADRPDVGIPDVKLPDLRSEEAEALAELAELVSGEGPFDIADSDEFIEGKAADLDHRVLIALRRGEYATQGHLDLHGLTRVEAREAVETFLTSARRAGKRCVILIHGRGLNSKDQIPVLKEAVKTWLQRGRISRTVLAFCTARPHDGGAGALYVLLRKPGRDGGP